MNASARIALGVIAGSLLTLIIDSRSRPIALAGIVEQGRSTAIQSSNLIPQNSRQLSPPQNLIDASMYMQVGAIQLGPGGKLSSEEITTLLRVAEHAAKSEPSNAFWKQMIAVLELKRGRATEARTAWLEAATCTNWRDYQSERLFAIAKLLSRETGTPMAWHVSRAMMFRSDACANTIRQTGTSIISKSSTTSKGGLVVRYATLENGRLLRDGSRSITSGLSGVTLIELASLPPGIRVPERSPRNLIVSRLEFVKNLRGEGFPDEAKIAERAFSVNDAWSAFLNRDEADGLTQRLVQTSLVSATLPSALLMISLIGIAVLGLSKAFERWPKMMVVFRAPFAPAIGGLAAIVLYLTTDLLLLALTAVLCIGFVAFTPSKTRSRPPDDLGPLFKVVCGTFVVVFVGLLSVFIIGLTRPAIEISELAVIPPEYIGGGTLPLGLAFIVLCLLCVAAPSWAFVQRIDTTRALTIAFRQFGSYTMWLCLVFGILAVPAGIFIDSRTEAQLSQILANEPNYYILDARFAGFSNTPDR
ncbi:MAG: hypothetical protein KF784_01205 [Fimbriimonadaceae bacterium]|nr:hypothetical protein [Fimbriimonadaceae bacterium]